MTTHTQSAIVRQIPVKSQNPAFPRLSSGSGASIGAPCQILQNSQTLPENVDLAALLSAAEDPAKRLSEAVTDAHRSMGRAG